VALVQCVCLACGDGFAVAPSQIRRGRGKHCSRRCTGIRNAGNLGPVRPMVGAANPNWRGGRSARPYDSYVKAFKLANPEKARAHQLVAAAVRSGRLVRPDVCVDGCGRAGRVQAHHFDYARPLDVDWLCKSCHEVADLARRLFLHNNSSLEEGSHAR
jgi:hypothetical protein